MMMQEDEDEMKTIFEGEECLLLLMLCSDNLLFHLLMWLNWIEEEMFHLLVVIFVIASIHISSAKNKYIL